VLPLARSRSWVRIAGVLLGISLTACGNRGTQVSSSIPLSLPPHWTASPVTTRFPTPSPPFERATATLALTQLPPAAPTPELWFPASYEPVEHLTPGTPLDEFRVLQMIDESHGWAIGGPGGDHSHILFSEDSALSWRDVTPPALAPSGSHRAGIGAAFLDASNAWVVFNDMYLSEHSRAPLQVWHTADAGETWQPSKPLDLRSALYFTVEGVSFVDWEVGWLLAAVGPSSDPVQSALFRTADSGETWERLDFAQAGDGDLLSARLGKEIAFADRLTGMVTPDGPAAAPYVLWSEDGGSTWHRIDLPAPSWYPEFFETYEFLIGCSIIDSELISTESAVVLVECPKANGPDEALYRTSDGGRTWEAFSVPSDDYVKWSLEFLDPHVGWLLGPIIYETQDGAQSWLKVKQVSWDGARFTFVDQMLGWAVAVEDFDRGVTQYALVQTSNGGRTWQELGRELIP
jgi:photosystem II stability/assembly factor-like uncharacterized protein